jgi:HAD superfamily hydrolase (TIGR01509 family)
LNPVQPAALVFDLDGTIVDTESVEYGALRQVFVDHGFDYPLERWAQVVGRSWSPDWVDELEEALASNGAGTVDREALLARHRRIKGDLLARLVPRDGVIELFGEAVAAGVPIGVASNSPGDWVRARLGDLGLAACVAAVVTIDSVRAPKPHPAPFLEACAELGAEPRASIAFEDSTTGVASAVAAGLYTVACANPLTAGHDLSAADVVVDTLAGMTIARLGAGLAARLDGRGERVGDTAAL